MTNSAQTKFAITEWFNSTSCPRVLANVTHLLRCASTHHHMFSGGPVRQALLTQLTNPLDEGRSLALQSGIAAVRIQLETGSIYSIHLAGQFGNPLDRAIEAGAWLAGQAYDEGRFDRTERELAVVVNGVNCRSCTVRLDRNASVGMHAGISAKKATILGLGALNTLRAAEGLARFDTCPDELKSWFAEALSPSHPASAHFLANLDRDIVAFTGASPISGTGKGQPLRVYNFLAEVRGDVSRNRLQAFRAMPVLMHIFTATHAQFDEPGSDDFSSRAAAGILGAIDAAEPLLDAVARTLEVPFETVRWLRRRTLPPAWRMNPSRLKALLTLLSWIAPEKRPENHAGFEAMIEAANSLSEVLRPLLRFAQAKPAPLPPHYGRLFRRWMAELMWADVASSRARIGGLTAGRAELGDTGDFLLAMLSSLRRFCSIDSAAFAGADDARLTLLLEFLHTKSLRQMIGLSRRWHTLLAECIERRAYADDGATPSPAGSTPQWPGVLENPLCAGELTIVELTDTHALQAEGQAMLHCVGSYTPQCMSGNSLVFSVRDGAGAPLSTVELHLHADPLQVRQGQHRSTRNGDVGTGCQAAVAELVRFLNRAEQTEALAIRHQFQQARLLDLCTRRRLAADHADQDGLAMDAAVWSLMCGTAPPPIPIGLGALTAALRNSPGADAHGVNP